MIMRLFLSIMCISILLSIALSDANGAEFIRGVAKLSGQLTDGVSVKVEVRTMKLTPQYPFKDAFLWGGDVRGAGEVLMPKTAIAAIDVRIGNEKILFLYRHTVI